MKISIMLLLICFSVPACAEQPQPTIEEQILMKSFVGYISALSYDEICNGTDPKSRYDFKQKKNVMLQGNQQMLAARVGGLWHVRNPGKSVDEGVAHLIAIQTMVQEKFSEVIGAKGCDSDEARQAAKGLQLYSDFHPGVIFGLIDKSIVDAGGTVTSMEEIEAVGKP